MDTIILAWVNQNGGFAGAPGQSQHTITLTGLPAAAPGQPTPNDALFVNPNGSVHLTLNQPSAELRQRLALGSRFRIQLSEIVENATPPAGTLAP